MPEQLSRYKFKKLSSEAFKNGLRLHFDSILLFNNKSFPSAFQLSVLALEELSKSYWIEHYFYSSITNTGFPDKEFEQEWLNLLYYHPRKQRAFFGWGVSFDYKSDFIKFVEKGGLELKKQKATYVGLDKKGKFVDVNSRISLPTQIKTKDAKQIISLINDYLVECCQRKSFQDYYFELEEKDELLNPQLYIKLKQWKFRNTLKTVPSYIKSVYKSRK
jgi:AbiV family abortive infection protein